MKSKPLEDDIIKHEKENIPIPVLCTKISKVHPKD